MFESQRPLGQMESPNWRHVALAMVGLAAALLVGALTPDPAGRAGVAKHAVMRQLLELGPSILLLVATRLQIGTPGVAAAAGTIWAP